MSALIAYLLLAACTNSPLGFGSAPEMGTVNLAPDLVRDGPTGTQVGLSQQAVGGERYVVFHTADALVAEDTNGVDDVYLRDLETGQLEFISRTPGGAAGNAASAWATVSIDGRMVAFESRASDLVTGDTNGYQDIFVRDRQAGTTTLISHPTTGESDGDSLDAQVAGLGLAVVFASGATNLVSGDSNGHIDCFHYNLGTGALQRISLDRDGNEVVGSDCLDPSISYTGNQAVYTSAGTNLPGYNGYRQVYGLRLKNSKPFLLSYRPDRQAGSGDCASPTISAYAKRVVFTSTAEDISPSDANGKADIFLFNLEVSTGPALVSLNGDGQQLDDDCTVSALSGDGTRVAFITSATNVVAADSDSQPDAYLRDLDSGEVWLMSQNVDGEKANGPSGGLSLSLSGEGVAFGSTATNLAESYLVPGVYWRKLGSTLVLSSDAPFVSELTLSPEEANLTVSATQQFTALADGVDVSADCKWTSSDEAIATVSAEGLVTGVSGGEVTIRAIYGGHLVEESLRIRPMLVLTPSNYLFNIDINGQVTELATTSTGGWTSVLDPAGRYLYVRTTNALETWELGLDVSLTRVHTLPLETAKRMRMIVDPLNRFLFVYEPELDRLDSYRLGPTGELELIQSISVFVFNPPSNRPHKMVCSPDGHYLYFVHPYYSALNPFRIESDGRLTVLAAEIDDSVQLLLVDKTRNLLYTLDYSLPPKLNWYRIGSDGYPLLQGSMALDVSWGRTFDTPDIALAPDGSYLFLLYALRDTAGEPSLYDGTLHALRLDTDGTPTHLEPALRGSTAGDWLCVTSDSKKVVFSEDYYQYFQPPNIGRNQKISFVSVDEDGGLSVSQEFVRSGRLLPTP
ncbi:MAG: Ig-like domain-containing protein [Vulcanimicrobiota bacterium]